MPENEPAAGYSQPTELGLAVRPVDVPVARSSGLALPLGALVREVRPGSPADKAGVLPGDVVLKIDDLAIRSPASIARAVSHVQSGRLARLVVRRGEKTLFLSVKKP
jgi:S1-C subfamily serine protease